MTTPRVTCDICGTDLGEAVVRTIRYDGRTDWIWTCTPEARAHKDAHTKPDPTEETR